MLETTARNGFKPDVAGGGINYAQRVMDAGGAGHVLMTRAVAENVNHLGRWSQHLHELGEIEVKHGFRLHVFDLYSEEFGNPSINGILDPCDTCDA